MTSASTVSRIYPSAGVLPAEPATRAVGDREWLVPVAAIVSVETLLWCVAYLAGYAVRPMIATYGSIAFGFFTLAICFNAARLLIRERPVQPLRCLFDAAVANKERILVAVLGSMLLALGSAAFGSLKAGIPRTIPFWFDGPVSQLEVRLFGTDAWAALHSFLGGAVPFFDRLYSTFVGTHLLAVLALLALKPSPFKSRALIALVLAWLVLGVIGAYLLSSAGPIFYDRVYGGHHFSALTRMLEAHAPVATFTADALWSIQQEGIPRIGNGISAAPSMHVTLTLWLALVLRKTRFALLAWIYWGLIWIGSVLLGWHWFFDGLIGSAGMLVLWGLAPRLCFAARHRPEPLGEFPYLP